MLLAATAQGLAGAWFEGQVHHPGVLAAPDAPSHPHLQQAALALAAYAIDPGDTAPVASLPLDAGGTPFQQRVWQALRAIPPGQTSHYGALARALGLPRAARAVGAAVGRNPLSVIVPCHRVLGKDGALTGYAGGLDRKQRLLQHEGAVWRTAP
jgi:methylated-DNA-[protein]-cysteine S-methyltransferase